MCGILVVWSKDAPVDAAACRRAMCTIAWRGPDFSMTRVWQDRLFLGQNVLSISGEPGCDDSYHRSRSGRWEVFYNGEIYNSADLRARFLDGRHELASHTGSDTELLANLHETLPAGDVPAQLDGMFAYALFDETAQTLALARDPQGEKILYLYEDESRFIAASEIRPILLLVPRLRPDAQALRDYFHTRHLMLGGRSVYPGIRELAPGAFESLALDTGRWTRREYAALGDWIEPARMERNARRSADSLTDELEALLDRSVREMLPRHHRYAAVVSGGVDSSLIASSVLGQGSPHLLISVDHPGKDPIAGDLSGFEHALGQGITSLRVDAGLYAADVTRCQAACGSPLPSHSFVAQSQQSAAVRAAGCRVLFGGDAADELFGGYPGYLECRDEPVRYSPSPYTAYREPCVRFERDDAGTIQNQLAAAWDRALAAYAHMAPGCDRQRLAMMFCDAEHQLPAVAMRGADVMSMMWSVEARSVFVRKPLVQFALNLPPDARADTRVETPPLMRTKPLLKRLFLRRFPAALLHEKQGFAGFPNESGAWLGRPDDFLAIDYLGIDRRSMPAAMADRHDAWKLINVEYFLRHATI